MNTTIASLSAVPKSENIALAKRKDPSSVSASEKGTAQSQVRASTNEQIIQASLKVSLSAANNSQSLLFHSAMEGIYESMGGESRPNIIEEYQSPPAAGPNTPNMTPQESADIILGFSLGMFASFAEQNPGMDEPEMAEKFINTIRGGFQKGFDRAAGILDAMGVFKGDLKAEVEKTYELVMKGYDDFLAAKRPVTEAGVEPTPTGS